MNVCMFVKNSFEYDARVTKEARTLIAAGHDVTVVAIHVPGVTAEEETTEDGIHVRRVSRVHFGLATLNKVAGRYAGSIETRHAKLTGEPVDVAKQAQLSAVVPASTATPGANQHLSPTTASAAVGDRASLATKAWAAITTPILRGFAHTARFGFRAVKAVLGRQGLALKTWAINKRMIAIGLEVDPDVFHSHDLNTLYIGWQCAEATGAKLVYDSHELATERNRMDNKWRKWAMWNERRGLPKADALITASPAWIPFLVERYGRVPESAIEIINVPEYHETVPVWDLRGELSIPEDVPILLYQGSIQENRGIEQALEATLMLENAVLVVVGYGYHRPTLEAQVAARGIGDRVKFFGPIPNHELLFWTAAADIGMANIINSSISYHTSLPNKLFEYIMAGVPVIGSDSPEIGRIVKETGVGVPCDPADPEAIAEAARIILADKNRYVDATKIAARQYNWTVESQKLIDLYEALST